MAPACLTKVMRYHYEVLDNYRIKTSEITGNNIIMEYMSTQRNEVLNVSADFAHLLCEDNYDEYLAQGDGISPYVVGNDMDDGNDGPVAWRP